VTFKNEDGVPQGCCARCAAAEPKPVIAVLSYEYFRRRYGANAAILGHRMRATGGPSPLVVGVLAPNFRLYFPPEANEEAAPDIWIGNRLDYDAAERNNFAIGAPSAG
jgi:hypothetical protein